jgi:transposase-like protein
MNRKPNPPNPPCPRCGVTHGIQNGSKGGRPRWVCRNGGRSFGPTLGTVMDRWPATPTEVARPLRVGMRRGSRSAAEAITGHKYETVGRWRRMAARHAEALTEVLVHDRHRSEVEVDAFGSFVKKAHVLERSERGRGQPSPSCWALQPKQGNCSQLPSLPSPIIGRGRAAILRPKPPVLDNAKLLQKDGGSSLPMIGDLGYNAGRGDPRGRESHGS